jgi:hypothetical protein
MTPHKLDPGVREPVELLNSIDGVTTRASCEGQGAAPLHRHSMLAYVSFAYPLPLQLQESLVAELGMIARVDDDAIYCRWPSANRQFLERLRSVVLEYTQRNRSAGRSSLVAPLSELQSRLLSRRAEGKEAVISACRCYPTLVLEPHGCRTTLALLRWLPPSSAEIFRDFVAVADNRLDPGLVAALGVDELQKRARRGDFGPSFRRRWLHFHGRRTRHEIIVALRNGVQDLRRSGKDLDILFDNRCARVTWRTRSGVISS